MKKMIMMFALLAAFAGFAEEIFVGAGEEFFKNVADGSTEAQSERAAVAPDGRLYKTGIGAWQIPFAYFSESPQFYIAVKEGSLQFTDDAVAPVEYDVTNILNKAAIWVTMDSVVTTNCVIGGVETPVAALWRDQRDTDAGVTNYPYAAPFWSKYQTGYSSYGIPPVVQDVYDKAGIYFNGYGNDKGKAMRLKKQDGSNVDLSNIRHLFYVSTVSNSVGYTLGAYNDSAVDFERHDTVYNNPSSPSRIRTGRSYLNGILIDPFIERIKKGIQLYDFEAGVQDIHVGYFFNDRGMPNDRQPSQHRSGGDYLHEVVFFTNNLTAAEHWQVREYLMKKWNLSSKKGLRSWDAAKGESTPFAEDSLFTRKATLHMAEGATVRSAEEFENVEMKGLGTYVVSDGEQIIRAMDGRFNGEVRVEGGSAVLREPVAVSVKSGDKFTSTVSMSGKGTIVERTGGASAGVVEQTGNGNMIVAKIPAEVKTYKVTTGTLSLTAPGNEDIVLTSKSRIVEAIIPNNSFEGFAGENKEYTRVLNGNNVKTNTMYDWTGIGTDLEMFYFNRQVAAESDWMTANFGFKNMYAPDGDCMLGVKADGVAYTTITVPEPGTYKFTCMVNARYDMYYVRNYIDFYVADTTGNNRKKFGEAQIAKTDAFQMLAYKVTFEDEGTYPKQFRLYLDASRLNVDGTTLFDDLHLVKTAEEFDGWEIPNGSFELFDNPPVNKYPNAADVPAGWVFTSENKYSYNGHEFSGVGVVSKDCTEIPVKMYSDLDDECGRWALALIKTGGIAKTTFTPPAGTYLLAADAKSYGVDLFAAYRSSRPSVRARAKIGDEVIDLGVIKIKSEFVKPVCWNRYIKVNGNEEVTIELSQTNGIAIAVLDNFRLTRDLSLGNYVGNGDFEDVTDSMGFDSAPWVLMNRGPQGGEDSWSRIITYDANPFNRTHFIKERLQGYNYARLRQNGYLEQPITLPQAGFYEVSMLTSCRPNNYQGQNPIRVWLAKDNVTNEVARFGVTNHYSMTQKALFDLPEAGDYTLGIQGCAPGEDRASNFDNVRIFHANFAKDAPQLHEELSLVFDNGAKLALNFPGTQEVYSVKFDGVSLVGEINAATHPDLIEGIGTLMVKPRGTILIIR